jgi:hypothetical protein
MYSTAAAKSETTGQSSWPWPASPASCSRFLPVSTNDEQVGFGTTACKNEAWLVDWICQMSTNDL